MATAAWGALIWDLRVKHWAGSLSDRFVLRDLRHITSVGGRYPNFTMGEESADVKKTVADISIIGKNQTFDYRFFKRQWWGTIATSGLHTVQPRYREKCIVPRKRLIYRGIL